MAAIDKFFANPTALPTMPEVAHKVMRAFNDDRVSLGSLANLIGQDQSLTVKLMRLANSARFSPRQPVATIQDAAATVGLTNLRDLSLAACVAGAFPAAPGFDRLRFWRQCLACAGHARTLAQVCGVDADEAYLGGLVLRTGELLMLMTDPDNTLRAQSLAHLPDSQMDHERNLLSCTHAEVSAELARRWKFPPALVAALVATNDPMATRPFSRMGAVLRLAQVMSEAGDRNLPALTTLTETQAELVAHLPLDLDWLALHMMPFDALTAGVEQLLH